MAKTKLKPSAVSIIMFDDELCDLFGKGFLSPEEAQVVDGVIHAGVAGAAKWAEIAKTPYQVKKLYKQAEEKYLAAKAVQPQVTCPDCGTQMELKKSRHGLFYGCPRYPNCKGTHGAHPDGRPFGTPASSETKQWRIKAHEVFNPLYEVYPPGKNRRIARANAYKWMANVMGLTVEDAHIGKFTIEQCKQLIELIEHRFDKAFEEGPKR